MEVEERIPLKRALGYVLASVVVLWGLVFLTWLVHQRLLGWRQRDPHYKIVAIAQTTTQRERLASWELAELLDLSRNEPQNLYVFDPKLAEKRLLSYPIFKRATCRRLQPGIVHVDYLLREPIAELSDFDNLAIDAEGYVFPLTPYFTPKRLPELSLGLETTPCWNEPLKTKTTALAFEIMNFIQCHFPASIHTLRIDTRSAFQRSAGLCEVVLLLQDGPRRYLRLIADDYEQTLKHYLVLRDTFNSLQKDGQQVQVIDLRSPNIALVS